MKIFLYGLGLFLFLLTNSAAGNDVNIPEDWVEPHPWGSVQKVSGKPREVHRKSTIIGDNCPKDEAHLFYTKLVNFLFDRSKLQDNLHDDKLTRTLHLHITPDLLERLKEAKTAREIDSVVFEVIEMSRAGKIEQVKEIVISLADVITVYTEGIYNSDELLFVSLAVGTLFFVWFTSRTLRRNIVLVFILTIISISYLLTYLDCNRRLEIKKLMELSAQTEGNPCQVDESYMSYFSWFKSKYSEDECLKHLQKAYGPQRSICGPTEVFLQFFSHLAMTQIITFFQESHTVINDVMKNHSWKDNLLVIPFILGLSYFVLVPLIKYIIQYSMPTIIRSVNEHGELENSSHNSRNPPATHDGNHLVLTGESVQQLLILLNQNSTVTLRDAENILQAEVRDRVEELSEPKTPEDNLGTTKETENEKLAEIEPAPQESVDCDATLIPKNITN